MKTNSLLFSIVIIIAFFFIQISYNGSPSYGIFSFLQKTIEYDMKNGIIIKFKDYPLEFNLLMFEIIISCIFLIVASFFNNKIKLFSIILFFGIWLKNYIMLDFVVDSRKYLISSIPFIILLLIYWGTISFKYFRNK